MKNFFDMESPLIRALSRLADLMILNICFIISCIPIFTIGAALTGMYYVTLKMAAHEEGYIFRAYVKSFKQNFRQSTLIWLIVLAVGVMLGVDVMILMSSTGSLIRIMFVLILATILFYLMVVLYVFPLQSRFENKIATTIKNALILSIAQFPKTILMLVITIGAVLLTLWNSYTIVWGLLVWLLVGFSALAYIHSIFLNKTFAKFIPDDSEEDSDPDAWVVDELPSEEPDAALTGSTREN
jgi:uncharacterized membrane protein YesL